MTNYTEFLSPSYSDLENLSWPNNSEESGSVNTGFFLACCPAQPCSGLCAPEKIWQNINPKYFVCRTTEHFDSSFRKVNDIPCNYLVTFMSWHCCALLQCNITANIWLHWSWIIWIRALSLPKLDQGCLVFCCTVTKNPFAMA